MKILILGQPNSQHNVNFVRRLRTVYPLAIIGFFPSSPAAYHPELQDSCDILFSKNDGKLIPMDLYWLDVFEKPLSRFSGSPQYLAQTIDEFQPTFIQINCIQDAGYLLDAALTLPHSWNSFRVNLCIWGNDLFFHREKIISFLKRVDLIIPESSREINLAASLGYCGQFTCPVEATLVTFEDLVRFFPDAQKNKRNLILIKGAAQPNRNSSGALIQALSNLRGLLSGYEICILSPSTEDFKNLQLFTGNDSVSVQYIPNYVNQDHFYKLLAEAKFIFSTNYSDGVPNTFLEACAAFTYPVLSSSASMEDWSESNVTLLNVYDVRGAEEKLHKLFINEELIKKAVISNYVSLMRYKEDRVNMIVKSFYP